jgi:hypothetical protein
MKREVEKKRIQVVLLGWCMHTPCHDKKAIEAGKSFPW